MQSYNLREADVSAPLFICSNGRRPVVENLAQAVRFLVLVGRLATDAISSSNVLGNRRMDKETTREIRTASVGG